jgi:hypothetical protein
MRLVLLKERTPYSVDKSLDAALLRLSEDNALCLQGYWQCPAYFADAEETIRREFSFKAAPSPANSATLAAITAACSVALHIRRGDYLQVKNQPVLSRDYYRRAVEVLTCRVGTFRIFVFSDDIDWARTHLRLPCEMTFVAGNTKDTAHEDLRLMAACKHYIIANSSFSWWGAWLDPRRDKVVVSPKYWGCTLDSYFPELIPPGWIWVENL